ncbi:MAG: LuxR C-terminal-related transcriptional regulator [Sedimentibacter sp.]
MTTDENKPFIKISERNLAVLVFSLFFSWLLAFPFEGQILYELLEKYNIYSSNYIFKSITAHLIGLLSCAFFVKNMKTAKMFIAGSIIVCITGTSVFLFEPSMLWDASLIVSSYAAGASVAAWAYYFKELTDVSARIKMAADGLIFSNVLMIVINVISVNISAYAGLIFSIVLLLAALIFTLKLPTVSKIELIAVKSISELNIVKPLILLCIFIIITTINSGLTYQVINPFYVHLEILVSWYWALPYIVAIFIIKNISNSKRIYMLYVAIAMIGLGFISFLVLDNSAVSYIVIDTLMLGAFGIYDLFWWSVIGEMLDYTNNPAKLLGIGLSCNVAGVLIGGMVGSSIYSTSNSKLNASLLALVVVFTILIILPVLHSQLTNLLKIHAYKISVKVKEYNDESLLISQLTERENQIASLLLKGRTYKMIAEELYLSENTVKTHIKNIYSKLNIQSKAELIKLIAEKR